jgi:uncharacterized protein (DUF2062 family)
MRTLWLAAKNERGSPREIALAVALGFFVGCSPALGVHGWVAVGVATPLKLSRLYAFIGSRICNFVTLPIVAIAQIQASHRLRTGHWVELTRHDVLSEGPKLLGDWFVGMVLVGAPLAVLVGAATYAWAFRRQQRRAAPE